MKGKTLAVLAFIIVSVVASPPARGDWVENWLSGSVASYTGPSYIEAGRRGYLSLGSFSTRTLMTNDRLITFTAPSLSFGCGGIDIFTGGFSFLNFDYLVDKLQRIISAAPAFAFEYALRSICQQCGAITDSLESIQDLLNNLQLSDCQASQWLGYQIASLGDNAYEALRHKLKPTLAKLDIVSGKINAWKEKMDEWFKNSSSPGRLPSAEAKKANEGCPGYLMNLVNSGSLVHYIKEQYFPYLDSSFEALVRGYLGDVAFGEKDNVWSALRVPSCGSYNTANPLEAMVSGRALVKASLNSSDACKTYTDAFPSAKPLGKYVEEKLTSAYSKVLSGTDLTRDETNLMALLPNPVYYYLKQLYVYDAPVSAVANISDAASYGLAYTLLAMTYAETEKAMTHVKNLITQCAAETPSDKACELCSSTSSLWKELQEYRTNVYKVLSILQKDWNTKLTEFQQRVTTTISLVEAIDNTVRGKIARKENPVKAR